MPNDRRQEWVDALRVLALWGVFVVNAMGYATAPVAAMPMGELRPVGSWTSAMAIAWVAVFVQGKAYPVLSFLFGYSMALSWRSQLARAGANAALAHRKRRMWRLLWLGVLHGTFLYFGDILTAYALLGLAMTRWPGMRPRQLITRMRVFFALMSVAIGIVLLALLGESYVANASMPVASAAANATGLGSAVSFAHVHAWGQWWQLNAATYWILLVPGLLFYGPLVGGCMCAGALAGRFQLLSNRSHARKFWARHFGLRHWRVALWVNAAFVALDLSGKSAESSLLFGLSLFSMPAKAWLGACMLAAVVRSWQQSSPTWVQTLAPAGQYTLSMYVALSACLALSSGAGWGFPAHSALALVAATVLYAFGISVALALAKRRIRGPMEAWLARS